MSDASIPARFGVGWAIATLVSIVGVVLSAKLNLPIGAAIVCALAVTLMPISLTSLLRRAN